MEFIIENAYTKKLFLQLNVTMTKLQLIAMADIATLDSGFGCIVDEDDYESFEAMHYDAREVIILTEKKLHDLPLKQNVRTIKKYQSTRNILTLVSQSTFPVTFLGFAIKSIEKELFINNVRKKYDIDRVISLDFNPNSSFSLFDCLAHEKYKILNQANLDVITNIQDYLNPPTSDIIVFIDRLKETNRLLIVSSTLKGKLDAAIMDLADTIILVENDQSMKLEPYLSHRLKTKRFEVMSFDAS